MSLDFRSETFPVREVGTHGRGTDSDDLSPVDEFFNFKLTRRRKFSVSRDRNRLFSTPTECF